MYGKCFSFTDFTSDVTLITMSEVTSISESGWQEESSTYVWFHSRFYLLPFLLLNFEKHSKSTFAPDLKLSRTNFNHSIFFFTDLYSVVHQHSMQISKKKKKRKKQFAPLMLMYGVIFSDSFNAIYKRINKDYKTKPICTTHNTQGEILQSMKA